METVGHGGITELQDTFQTEVYVAVIDCLLAELDSRFSANATAVMTGIQSLGHHSKTFLSLTNLQEMATNYDMHASSKDLVREVPQAKRLLERKAKEGVEVNTLQQLVVFMEPYKDAFHSLFRLMLIAVVLSVSTASCERSFSAMRLIKTYLRSSIDCQICRYTIR